MRYTAFSTLLLLLIGTIASGQDNRIQYNGKVLFLNGTNAAWINFGKDIGPDTTDFESFERIFKEIHESGGNCMRLWLHANGVSTPQFSGPEVIGPGKDAICDLSRIVDLAYTNDVGLILCLWSFDMLRKSNGELINSRNKGILTEDALMNFYIENALVPMVDSLKHHPGIIAWEIFNEPEGMCNDVMYCSWDYLEHISISNVQKFINRCASAIHTVDPSLLVTNGGWSLISTTDRDGFHNYYKDSILIAAGGNENGILDFYCVHHYDWLSTSPFEKPISYWDWDKPVVLAEFYPGCKNCGPFSNYEYLYKAGYAGALGWSLNDGPRAVILKEMQYMMDAYPSEIKLEKKSASSKKTGSPEY